MDRLMRKLKTGWCTASAAAAVGVALTACGGEMPSSPSTPSADGPGLTDVAQTAAARSPLSVSPRSVRLQCNSGGFPCDIQVIVTSSVPVALDYFLNGDFIINAGATTCVRFSTLAGSCTIGVSVGTTEFPGRRSGTLTVNESTTGTSKTVRLAARVS